jgi:hypothetical protein
VVLYGCETWSLILKEEQDKGAEQNICPEERLSVRRFEKTA